MSNVVVPDGQMQEGTGQVGGYRTQVVIRQVHRLQGTGEKRERKQKDPVRRPR